MTDNRVTQLFREDRAFMVALTRRYERNLDMLDNCAPDPRWAEMREASQRVLLRALDAMAEARPDEPPPTPEELNDAAAVVVVQEVFEAIVSLPDPVDDPWEEVYRWLTEGSMFFTEPWDPPYAKRAIVKYRKMRAREEMMDALAAEAELDDHEEDE